MNASAAQAAARDKMRPGVEMKQANQAVIDFYKKALRAAKLIRDDSEVSKYYYHGVSHSLGLDTHVLVTESEPEDLIGNRLLDVAEIEELMGR